MSEFDVAIRGARVLDGTGNPWYSADLGIRAGRLAHIGRMDRAEAHRVIDADGLAIDGGKPTGARPGQPILGPGYAGTGAPAGLARTASSR